MKTNEVSMNEDEMKKILYFYFEESAWELSYLYESGQPLSEIRSLISEMNDNFFDFLVKYGKGCIGEEVVLMSQIFSFFVSDIIQGLDNHYARSRLYRWCIEMNEHMVKRFEKYKLEKGIKDDEQDKEV